MGAGPCTGFHPDRLRSRHLAFRPESTSGTRQHQIFPDPLQSSSEPFRNRYDPTSSPKRWPDRSFRIRRYGPSVRCFDEVAPHRLNRLPFRRRDDRFDDEPIVFDRPTDSRGNRPGSAMSMMVAPPGLRSGSTGLRLLQPILRPDGDNRHRRLASCGEIRGRSIDGHEIPSDIHRSDAQSPSRDRFSTARPQVTPASRPRARRT